MTSRPVMEGTRIIESTRNPSESLQNTLGGMKVVCGINVSWSRMQMDLEGGRISDLRVNLGDSETKGLKGGIRG